MLVDDYRQLWLLTTINDKMHFISVKLPPKMFTINQCMELQPAVCFV